MKIGNVVGQRVDLNSYNRLWPFLIDDNYGFRFAFTFGIVCTHIIKEVNPFPRLQEALSTFQVKIHCSETRFGHRFKKTTKKNGEKMSVWSVFVAPGHTV